MSKRSLIASVTLVLALPPAAAAQPGLGIKAGASFGNISNRGLLPGNLKTRTGMAAGLSLFIGGSVIGVEVEGLYAQRGAESDEPIATADTKLDYIDIPGYLKLRAPTPGIQPFIYAGPQVSYIVRCRTANGTACNTSYSSPSRPRWDYAGIIGAGIRIGGAVGLSIEGRYLYGLTDLRPATLISSSSYKTRSFMLLGSIGQ